MAKTAQRGRKRKAIKDEKPKAKKEKLENETAEKEPEEQVEEDEEKDESAAFKEDEKNKEETSTIEITEPQNFNLKIMSWNVNGIRKWVDCKNKEKDFVLKEKPDIICLQETKCDKAKIPPAVELKGYQSYWHSCQKTGYCGVGLMTKLKPISVTYGLKNIKFDGDARVITAEFEKYFLINTYVPNSGRNLPRLPFRIEWEIEFLKYIKELDSRKPVIWCGDLNVAHQKIDIKNPDSNKRSAGFTQEERDCFTKILDQGFIDSFRLLYPSKEGAYTYWSNFSNARANNVGWRLDYFVLSERLKQNLVESGMRPEQKGSDHCPIVLYMNL